MLGPSPQSKLAAEAGAVVVGGRLACGTKACRSQAFASLRQQNIILLGLHSFFQSAKSLLQLWSDSTCTELSPEGVTLATAAAGMMAGMMAGLAAGVGESPPASMTA